MSRQIAILLFCSLIGCVRVSAQTYSSPGMFSGSGFTLMPDAAVAPKAEMRLDFSRSQFVRGTGKGSNNIVLGAGMSSNLEVYLRLIGEQVGTVASATSMAYGAKLRLPFRLPVVRGAALWFEAASGEATESSSMLAMPMTRVGLVSTTGPNGAHAIILAGAASNEQSTSLMAGLGWVQPFSHTVAVSSEAIYGYFGARSYALMINGAVRFLSNFNVQLSPGYCRSNDVQSAMITVGLSISTSPFDFEMGTEEKKVREEFVLPTIDELEKEGKEKPKDFNGSGGLEPMHPMEPIDPIDPMDPMTPNTSEIIPKGNGGQ